MASLEWETSWIWHPNWSEEPNSSSAGGFVYFRKTLTLEHAPVHPVFVKISADTRYKLYINSSFIHTGPVKGDEQLWFYDLLDLQPHLRPGKNHIVVQVLRFYYASRLATSFPRTPFGGFFIDTVQGAEDNIKILSDPTWETAIDRCKSLPTDLKADDFLHIYEKVDKRQSSQIEWVAAKPYQHLTSYGLTTPWNLQERMIPYAQLDQTHITAVHNVRSTISSHEWENLLFNDNSKIGKTRLCLPKGTVHHIELELEYHTTAYLELRFARPQVGGSSLCITYSEGYEDAPTKFPYARNKADRRDHTKQLIGPQDSYIFGGHQGPDNVLCIDRNEIDDEVYAPFHFRTFRILALDIQVTDETDLVFKSLRLVQTNYPLKIHSSFQANTNDRAQESHWVEDLWTVSLRTLKNCMHDCYEDCPFFEQLQYAMDSRSSSLFTYVVSRDDRLARQAIIQLHNSYSASTGLTASRAPSHHRQSISHFSLFWICMVTDHYEYFRDAEFVDQFLPTAEAILRTFKRRLDQGTGLIQTPTSPQDWTFVDWTSPWKPFGTPPAAQETGFLTFTNALYAYTLQKLGWLEASLDRVLRASEHRMQAVAIVQAIRAHCFDGNYFTDGLAKFATSSHYSEHSQVWAVLCGAVSGQEAVQLLRQSLSAAPKDTLSHLLDIHQFTRASTAMSFYTMRALSSLSGGLYEECFHRFWDPWRAQLAQNLTTWVEDDVSQRSDCHAWGSLPLYEFTTEVVGFKPSLVEKDAVTFKPRMNLFKNLDAKVPVAGVPGTQVVAHVRWSHDADGGHAVLSLAWETPNGRDDDRIAPPRVHMVLPNGHQEMLRVPEFADLRVSLK